MFDSPDVTGTYEISGATTGPLLTILDDYSWASDWKPLPAGTSLYGPWLGEGGGYLLVLAPKGTYLSRTTPVTRSTRVLGVRKV